MNKPLNTVEYKRASTENTPEQAELISSIMSTLAKWESQRIRERTKAGLAKLKKQQHK